MGKSEAWANRIALAKMYFDRGDIKSKPANGGLRRQRTQYRIISSNRQKMMALNRMHCHRNHVIPIQLRKAAAPYDLET